MGFLNFLTRRSNHDGGSDRSFRLQNGYPMLTASVQSVGAQNTGRRPSLEKLHYATAKGQSRQQLAETTKPHFLGLRSDRPGTANSERRPSLLRSASSRGKVYRTTDSDTKSLTPSMPSMTASKSYTSMRTGHVDLLDAQGGLKPYDFRSRLHAAGARDYGEDVAERNMGENGVDVRSTAAQEFYEKQKRMSTTTLSNMSYSIEGDLSTYADSETDDMSNIEASIYSSRSLSRLSMEPRREVSGIIARGTSRRETKSSLSVRGRRDQSSPTQTSQMPRQASLSSSRGRSNSARYWISTEQPVSASAGSDKWELRQLSTKPRSRSISPPCVPRYRPGSSMATMHEEDDYPNPNSRQGRERQERHGRVEAVESAPPTRRDASSILRRDDFQNDNLGRVSIYDSEGSDYDIPSSRPQHAPKPRIVPAAPPQYHPEWQEAVQRAVEESLAKLPISADLKALLELSQGGVPLDDLLQKVPLHHSSLHQGSIISTAPSTELSDYASSNTGRPHSRHTATTSIDSSRRIDLYHKNGSSIHEDKGSTLDQYSGSPELTPADDEEIATADITMSAFQSETAKSSIEDTHNDGIKEVDEYECLTSDYSDVDSFTEKRRQVLHEDEAKLFNEDKFGDISSNLPGIVHVRRPQNCLVCNILVNLRGGAGPAEPCNHTGSMTQKQRLRALGYDYESEDSDTEREVAPARNRGRTKRLTVGSNGGLRRLKLVDDRIDEASEEEHGDGSDAKARLGLRRKSKGGSLNARRVLVK